MSWSNFLSLVKDVVNNLDNKDDQPTISNNKYDLKNAEKLLLEIVTKKINGNEAHKLYENLIEPKVIELTRAKSRGKNKRLNILNIYNNIKSSIFDGVYPHYFDKPVIAKESIAKSAESRKKRLDIINKKKENIK